MANQMRWRYGDTQPVMAPVLSATVIEIGDLLWLDGETAKPAAALPNAQSRTVMANQKAFHDSFLGVALAASRAGDNAMIRVATRGVFELACPVGTYNLGDLLGLCEATPESTLDNQKVKSVATANLAIGRCTQAVPLPSARVQLEIVSTILHGGPQEKAS